MSSQEPLMCQLVELLGISETTGLPPSNEPVVIITVRPQSQQQGGGSRDRVHNWLRVSK